MEKKNTQVDIDNIWKLEKMKARVSVQHYKNDSPQLHFECHSKCPFEAELSDEKSNEIKYSNHIFCM